MNHLYRWYCRSYQWVFRALLPVLPYREPKLLDSLAAVPDVLREAGKSTVLLVADGTVRKLGLTEPLESALTASGIRFAVYEQHTQNPTTDDVESARAVYIDHSAEAIVAVGGGSAIDCAKAVGARIARPNKDVRKMRGMLSVWRETPLLIAAPTTAGTGSEATVTAVITDAKACYKYTINDFKLIPDYAVLDPKLTLGLPPHITATTGMDALTHAVEAYIGRTTTVLTRSMSEEAVLLIAQNLVRAFEHGDDIEARTNMLRASYCAGVSFTRSYVGYVHAIAHSLGGQYGIAHGLANAIILPHVLKRYGAACDASLAKLARIVGVASDETKDAEAAEAFIAWIEQLNRHFGIQDGFEAIREEDIPIMAQHAAKEANPLYPVPRLMDQDELEEIYHELMITHSPHL